MCQFQQLEEMRVEVVAVAVADLEMVIKEVLEEVAVVVIVQEAVVMGINTHRLVVRKLQEACILQ